LVARAVHYLTHNVAETTPGSAFPELVPREYAETAPDRLFAAVEQAVGRMARVRVIERDEEQRILRAVRTTLLLGYEDDLAVRVTDGPSGRGARLFVRAQSRTGQADFGANTRHVLDLYAALDGVLAPALPAAQDVPAAPASSRR
jgi:uncharacterized protein (DUF1499 family)